MNRHIIVSCTISLIIAGNCPVFAAFSADFATSDECAFCHTSSATALVDRQGNSLSIADDWSATMMGNSFRDPLFRAKLESEVARNPHLAEAIEDKCLTCHTPMARTQAIRDGAAAYSLVEAETTGFALDGVSCALCHQITDEGLGEASSFSGKYVIGTERKMFGPYKEVFPNPMVNHVDYLPIFGEQVDKPEFCATCHTLFTPTVTEEGTISGEFPEQTPYLEWLNSTYASPENYQSCQDCHMPKVSEPVKITNRPPWYRVEQSPFWKHHFTGGNRFILEMVKDNRQFLGSGVPEALFDRAIERTEERLSQESAEIRIVNVKQSDSKLLVEVHVANMTGHKFPTGFPSRRAWLHLTVTDSTGHVLFESGTYTADGAIEGLGTEYEPHHDIIDSPGQVQIYQSVMGDSSEKETKTLMRAATYLKDNRIPPAGYQDSGPMTSFTGIKGNAASDENFNRAGDHEGSGADTVTYEIDLPAAQSPLTIEGQILYQTTSPRFLQDLFNDDTPAVSRFKKMYSDTSNSPVIVDSATYEWRN